MGCPLVSVCLVTYNQEDYIRKVLSGAVNQKTSFPYEIVIGEDSSSDSTRSICQEFADRYPDLIRLLPCPPANLGLNLNMLRTYRACRGKYIAYLEGDDHWITTDKLQKQVDILESNDDVVLVHTNCKLWNVANNTILNHLIKFEGTCIREKQGGISGVIAEYEGQFRPMKTSTCMYRKDVFDSILAEDEYAYSNTDFPTQDFQLFQDMAYRGRFAYIDEDTTIIALADTISVSRNPEKMFRFRIGFNKIGIYYIQKYKIPLASYQIWLQKEWHWLLNFAMKHQVPLDVLEARWNHSLSIDYNPSYTQKILRFIVGHPILRKIVYPIYHIYYSKREEC